MVPSTLYFGLKSVCGTSVFTQYFTIYINKGAVPVLFKYIQHSLAYAYKNNELKLSISTQQVKNI